MKQILAVLKFTFMDAVRKKAFIISTLVFLAVITVATFIPNIIAFFSGYSDGDLDGNRSQICIFIDDTGLFDRAMGTLQQTFTDIEFIAGDLDLLDDYRAEIMENGRKGVIYVTYYNGKLTLNTIVRDEFTTSPSSFTPHGIINTINQYYIDHELANRGVNEETIEFIHSRLPVNTETVRGLDMSGYFIGFILSLLMFFSIYMYGNSIATSVASEKSSRVMETLVVSAKPSKILIGKCVAMGFVGLFQLSIIISYVLICYNLFASTALIDAGVEISLPSFSILTILSTIIYFIMGFMLYALLSSVCGASISRMEDLSHAIMPVSILAVLSYYLVIFTDSFGAMGAAALLPIYFPFSAPFVLPSKILNADITSVQLIISTAILVVTIIAVAFVSVRIYSSSVLHYGKRRKFKDMFKDGILKN